MTVWYWALYDELYILHKIITIEAPHAEPFEFQWSLENFDGLVYIGEL